MTYLSVCSGIEAASVAWEPLGWQAIGFSEIEPFPCELLKQKFLWEDKNEYKTSKKITQTIQKGVKQ